jgi:CheY-like chemotaxis protein
VTGVKLGKIEAVANPADLRILVVEDESLVAMMLADMLADLGCSVLGPVGSHDKALQLIAGGHAIGLALLDVNLGGENAYALADALAERRVPYVFVSGYGSGGIDPRYAKVPVLTKPLQVGELTEVVEAALVNARSTGS